jgi:ParB/RepB/Spo0J family partition protein
MTDSLVEKISIQDVNPYNRMRTEFGDIPGLAKSIKENGLLHPMRISKVNGSYIVIVGERRLKALTLLGVKELVHNEHFLWFDSTDALLQKSAELEENLRRQNLTWQEEVLGKQQLLEIMQAKYGEAKQGRQGKAVEKGLVPRGFSAATLASMLGESPAKISGDLKMAETLKLAPMLAEAPTKESARRQAQIIVKVLTMSGMANKKQIEGTQKTKDWTLYEGPFEDNCQKIPDASIDLIVTDLPYGGQVQGGPYHFAGVTGFDKTPEGDTVSAALKSIDRVMAESFRVLRQDRYAVFFFGFSYYGDLVEAIRKHGMGCSLVPIAWIKNSMSGENPDKRYRHAWEPAIYCWKGNAIFIRQARKDVMTFDIVPPKQKLMAPEKPVDLLSEFLVDMTVPGATVLDWMAGTGSFGEAALKLKRKVILCEKDPVACTMIKARLGAL